MRANHERLSHTSDGKNIFASPGTGMEWIHCCVILSVILPPLANQHILPRPQSCNRPIASWAPSVTSGVTVVVWYFGSLQMQGFPGSNFAQHVQQEEDSKTSGTTIV
ncbi:hypothetical protein SETIT_2G220500v2 [Setaria italica]|uniref:Uncharacterized protein n=1 Tax=Setaria italica TaxID=4555 RepID=A0A368Q3R5_SETIT|nr:hypothetical protein SETIT_2G220500v2 [Setaria italica]